ncbi:FkbM family methyltransferase [Spirosoma fluminis]
MADVYEIDALVRVLPNEPVIIDIGANAGFFDIQLLSKIEKATIYAYEPMPANVRTLQRTLVENPRLQQSVRLSQKAVTGLPLEKLDLFAEAEENSQVVASRFADFNENNTHKLTVPCITLTDIIQKNELQFVDLLKLDCEGSEYDIIYNTAPELMSRIRKMVIEVHDLDEGQNNINALNQYVQSLGYVTTHEPINSFCHAMEAIRQ